MFYRMKFDGWVGGILEASELFGSTKARVEWWPAGSTAEWVSWGKEEGLKPVDAACLAVARTALAKMDRGEMARADGGRIIEAAYGLAAHQGDGETLSELLRALISLEESEAGQSKDAY